MHVHMYVDMRVGMCAGMCVDIYVDMCVDMLVGTCIEICVGMSPDMRVDTCADMFLLACVLICVCGHVCIISRTSSAWPSQSTCCRSCNSLALPTSSWICAAMPGAPSHLGAHTVTVVPVCTAAPLATRSRLSQHSLIFRRSPICVLQYLWSPMSAFGV